MAASLLQALWCSSCLVVVLAASSQLQHVVVGSSAGGARPASSSGFRLELTHVDSKGNFTKSQLLQRAAHRSRVRAAVLSGARGRRGSAAVSTSAASATWDTRPNVHWSLNEYVVELQIGTPPVPFVPVVETVSDLIWTQSRPCTRCNYQPTPVYDPRKSRSFSPEPCASATCQPPPQRFNQLDYSCSNTTGRRLPQRCQYSYNNTLGANSKGVLGRETLTFPAGSSRPGASVSVSGVAFGCGHENTGSMYNSTGTLGLGRGPLSLLSQLGIGKFSYCLTDYFLPRRTSPLLFGPLADLGGGAAVQSTPLFQSPFDGTPYYVNLRGISIGQARLPIAESVFQFQNDGTGGGAIFDSSLSYTLLEQSAFQVVATHVASLLGMTRSAGTNNGSSIAADVVAPCYPLINGDELPVMPDMVLHFDEGADMVLHRDNYMILYKEQSAMCLAMGAIQGFSVIGNFQQQNMHVLFDIIGGYLSFVPADCSKL